MTATLVAPVDAASKSNQKLRVLVVDDSLIYRKVIRDTLASLPNVEVVGVAGNGKAAIEKIQQLRPDMLTLDFEMPELDGLGVLKWMKQERCPAKAVMISALTTEGAEATVQALELGAFDFVVKPNGSDTKTNQEQLLHSLSQHVQAISASLHRKVAAPHLAKPLAAAASSPAKTAPPSAQILPGQRRIAIVGIGVSTGGPDALRVMLPMLPADLPVPVVIVQHMPPVFTKSLAQSLDKMCKLRVSEGEDGQVVKPGQIVIAPGGKHLRIIRNASGLPQIQLTEDAPVQSCRPSVDYLFYSLAESFGHQTLSVIMTGMGYDGADGCRRLHQLGGPVIAQSEDTCVVFGMPRKPVEEGVADVVSPLKSIAYNIENYAGRKPRA